MIFLPSGDQSGEVRLPIMPTRSSAAVPPLDADLAQGGAPGANHEADSRPSGDQVGEEASSRSLGQCSNCRRHCRTRTNWGCRLAQDHGHLAAVGGNDRIEVAAAVRREDGAIAGGGVVLDDLGVAGFPGGVKELSPARRPGRSGDQGGVVGHLHRVMAVEIGDAQLDVRARVCCRKRCGRGKWAACRGFPSRCHRQRRGLGSGWCRCCKSRRE